MTIYISFNIIGRLALVIISAIIFKAPTSIELSDESLKMDVNARREHSPDR